MSTSATRLCVAFSALVIAFGVAGCRRADSAPAVAAVTVTPAHTRVPVGSPLDLTFKFDVAPSAQFSGNYTVFVHVIGSDGQLLWADDHEPAIPVSQWKPGQTVEYTRTRFVPPVPHPQDATVEVGLYHDNDRLPLQTSDAAARDAASRSYRVASLQIAPESENVFLIYTSGWHPEEFSPADPTRSWKWTQKTAVMSFKNPHGHASLLLEYDARPDIFIGHPQQITVTVDHTVITSFAADSPNAVTRRVPLPAAAFGAADMSELRLDVDRTFVPAALPAGGKDTRELGIRVYHAFVDGR